VACPGKSLCIAVTDHGDVLVGAPPPTTAQIEAILHEQLIPSQRDAALRALLRRGHYNVSLYAPVAGDLTITWAAVVKRGNRVQRVVVARGSRSTDVPASLKLRLSLTRTGRQLLRTLSLVRLSVTAKLSRVDSPTIVVTRGFATRH
jgi:hypothetical protein